MHSTPTPPAPGDISANRSRGTVRRATTAALFAVAFATVAPAAAAGAGTGPREAPTGCIVTRTADSLAFDVTSLITTVRIDHGVVKFLHDIVCFDGHSGTAWLTADLP